MANKKDLVDWLLEALKAHKGKASIVEVCKYIWGKHENELRSSGNLFFTWQYDVRWAATELRKRKLMRPAHISHKGIWELT